MAKVEPPRRWVIPVVDPLVQILFPGGIGRPSPLLLIIVAALLGYGAWRYQADRIDTDPLHQITPEKIVVTPRPDWITSDVTAEALRDGGFAKPPSGLDPQVAERIAKAFAAHPWVAEVWQVRKVPPGGLQVDLTYRRPACMVELPPSGNQKGLYAVDAAGILLPSRDFLGDPKKAVGYPRLGGFIPANVGRVGSKWPDERVLGGAAIGATVVDVWTPLNLAKIAPQDSAGVGLVFELLTRAGSRVIWGHAPGKERANEMSALQKVEALLRYAKDHGSLEGRDGPQQLDLSGPAITVVAQLPRAKNAK